MVRGGLAIALLGGLLGSGATQVPPQPSNSKIVAMAEARARDSYAVYSLLLPGEPFTSMSPDQAPHFAIAGTTVNIEDINPRLAPDSQLTPPPGNERAFGEALQDFRTRQYERVELARHFALDRDYTLVDATQIAELRQALGGADPGSLKDKWAGYPGITYLSEVYFNAAQTAALVYRNNYCANLCSNGQWFYLEKQNGQWVRRSGLNV